MVIMDFKGVSWVGDVYERFEAMCAEAEEIIYEDTLKYVENQVRTVGKTIKKFYSDVIEDLVPPSSLDPVKAEDPLLTEVHDGGIKHCKKTKLGDENEPLNAISEEVGKNIHGSAVRDDTMSFGSCRSGICSVVKPCKPTLATCGNSAEEKCTAENCQGHGAELVSLNQATSVANCRKDSSNSSLSNSLSINATITNNAAEEVTFIEPRNASDDLSYLPEDASSNKASVVSHDDDELGTSREIIEGYGSGDVIVEKMARMLSCGHMSTDLDGNLSTNFDETSSPCLADELGAQVGKQLNAARLEESCVLVDKNDKLYTSVPINAQKSNKKKIQDVFYPRRWSRSKRNQVQLPAWYEDKSEKKLVSTSLIHSGSQKSQSSESSDSDWELL